MAFSSSIRSCSLGWEGCGVHLPTGSGSFSAPSQYQGKRKGLGRKATENQILLQQAWLDSPYEHAVKVPTRDMLVAGSEAASPEACLASPRDTIHLLFGVLPFSVLFSPWLRKLGVGASQHLLSKQIVYFFAQKAEQWVCLSCGFRPVEEWSCQVVCLGLS